MIENNNGFNGYLTPYGGNNNNFNNEYFQDEQKKYSDKKEIRILGTLTGGAILTVFLMQNFISKLLELFDLYNSYLYNAEFQMGADMLVTVLSILVPFLIFGRFMKRKSGIADLVPLDKPKNKKLSLLAIPAGLGICMAANMVTSYVVQILSTFGIELTSPDLGNPSGASGFILSVLRVSVIAGLVEEISFRGCAMQPIRKFGDGFAIAMAACAFGLMHCNLIQAPFALIVGLGLGYIAVKTDSLWIPIIIHGLNNFISTAFSYMLDSSMNQTVVSIAYTFVVYFLMIAGLVALFFFVRRANQVSFSFAPNTNLTIVEKVGAYIINPTMIIAIILMLLYTAQYVTIG